TRDVPVNRGAGERLENDTTPRRHEMIDTAQRLAIAIVAKPKVESVEADAADDLHEARELRLILNVRGAHLRADAVVRIRRTLPVGDGQRSRGFAERHHDGCRCVLEISGVA